MGYDALGGSIDQKTADQKTAGSADVASVQAATGEEQAGKEAKESACCHNCGCNIKKIDPKKFCEQLLTMPKAEFDVAVMSYAQFPQVDASGHVNWVQVFDAIDRILALGSFDLRLEERLDNEYIIEDLLPNQTPEIFKKLNDSVLFYAIECGRFTFYRLLLQSDAVNCCAFNANGDMFLHALAAANNDEANSCIDEFLSFGQQPKDYCNYQHQTPYDIAQAYDNKKAARKFEEVRGLNKEWAPIVECQCFSTIATAAAA